MSYSDKLAGANVGKPRIAATVDATTSPHGEAARVATALPGAFDLDVATGSALDAVGVRVGIGRRIASAISGVYFALDDGAVGFDFGVWKGPFDPDEGVTVLDDDTYRTLIRARIAANAWDGTNGDISRVLDVAFSGDGMRAIVEDGQDMTMVIALVGRRPSVLLSALLTQGYLSVKPAGVRVAYYVTPTADDAPLFGFDTTNAYIDGLDRGAMGQLTKGA